ncbi:MAG TPA: sugar ABC transporter permease [Dictyobacter sp.]|jgi:cellobiose transport system permease protein|nr:sugar ABC transporter permease [Dictyobacter sp.]
MSTIGEITTTRGRHQTQTEDARYTPKSKLRKYLPLYLSVAPFFIVFLCFNLIPTLFSLYLAFQKWDGIEPMHFIGFNNFEYALTDSVFWQSVLNTFEIWIMSTIPMLFFALIIAFLLNQRKKSKFLFQVCYFLPYITSIVAITLIFGSLFAPQYGLINLTLQAAHIPGVQWLSAAWPMKWAIAILVIWRWTGYNALIYTAGLQSIPGEFYEAARVDGANTMNIFTSITLPLLRPVILFTVITSTIGGMTLFVEPQILFSTNGSTNGGGVGHAGLTMQLYQYWQAFTQDRYGYGAAVSWIMFFIILIFTFINWNVIMRNNDQ